MSSFCVKAIMFDYYGEIIFWCLSCLFGVYHKSFPFFFLNSPNTSLFSYSCVYNYHQLSIFENHKSIKSYNCHISSGDYFEYSLPEKLSNTHHVQIYLLLACSAKTAEHSKIPWRKKEAPFEQE